MLDAATRVFALSLALMLAACGDVRWRKPGSDDLAVANELAACRVSSRDSTQRMYGPPQISSGHGWLGAPSAEPSLADRQMREQEAVNRCMRDKGYALVPVER